MNSITEFHTMYFSLGSSQNTPKVVIDQSHPKGLMVHITSDDGKMKAKPANKINFVDLAGIFLMKTLFAFCVIFIFVTMFYILCNCFHFFFLKIAIVYFKF